MDGENFKRKGEEQVLLNNNLKKEQRVKRSLKDEFAPIDSKRFKTDNETTESKDISVLVNYVSR